jgi:hypothetical protein
MASKKYVVIPEETLIQLQKLASFEKPSNVYDSLLYDHDLGSYKKWRLYEQNMRRLADKPEPMKILIQNENEINDIKKDSFQESDNDYDEMVKALPINLQNTGKVLFEKLKECPDIYWDGNKTVVIDNKPIIGSNILDLVNYTMKQSTFKPRGLDEYLQVLEKCNVPISLINSPRPRKIIKNLKQREERTLRRSKRTKQVWKTFEEED